MTRSTRQDFPGRDSRSRGSSPAASNLAHAHRAGRGAPAELDDATLGALAGGDAGAQAEPPRSKAEHELYMHVIGNLKA